MPLNAKPVKRWIVRETPDGAGDYEWSGQMADTYESHYGTCPQAAQWRGRTRSGG